MTFITIFSLLTTFITIFSLLTGFLFLDCRYKSGHRAFFSHFPATLATMSIPPNLLVPGSPLFNKLSKKEARETKQWMKIGDSLFHTPYPMLVDGHAVWEIFQVTGEKTENGKVFYKVAWVGWPEDTWEPAEYLAHAMDYVEEYHRKDRRIADIVERERLLRERTRERIAAMLREKLEEIS